MNNDKLKFVVDSRSFDGSCVTTMSDGIHGDYHHETLEELRDREKNPYLIAVSGNTVRKMIRIHLQSLCAPFCEITAQYIFKTKEWCFAYAMPVTVISSLALHLVFVGAFRKRKGKSFFRYMWMTCLLGIVPAAAVMAGACTEIVLWRGEKHRKRRQPYHNRHCPYRDGQQNGRYSIRGVQGHRQYGDTS